MQVLHSVPAKIYAVVVGTNLFGTRGASLKGFFFSRSCHTMSTNKYCNSCLHTLCIKFKLLIAAFLAVIPMEMLLTIPTPRRREMSSHSWDLHGSWGTCCSWAASAAAWRCISAVLELQCLIAQKTHLSQFRINPSSCSIKPLVTWNWGTAQTALQPLPPSACVKCS